MARVAVRVSYSARAAPACSAMPAARERIQRSSRRRRRVGRLRPDDVARRPPARQARVGREEGQHVPEHQQLAPRLVGGVVAEEDVVLRARRGVHPAHDVDAHALGRLVELDGVAPRLVHGPAVLAVERGVAEDGLEGRLAAQHRAHGQHRVEPVAELAREGLGDEVGREPLLPVVGIGAVVQRAEGHDAGVEPGIAHVADAPRLRRRTRGRAPSTPSTQGRCGERPSSCSKPAVARSPSSSRPPMTW